MYHGPRGVPWPWGVPWSSRGVPWPLYEDHSLELLYYLYYSISRGLSGRMRSSTYTKNRKSERTPPWRTPQVTLKEILVIDNHITEQFILLNQLNNNLIKCNGTFNQFVQYTINLYLIKSFAGIQERTKTSLCYLLKCLTDSKKVNNASLQPLSL